MRSAWLVYALSAAAGCGGDDGHDADPPPVAAWQAGAMVVPQRFVTEEGEKVGLAGFHQVILDYPCAYGFEHLRNGWIPMTDGDFVNCPRFADGPYYRDASCQGDLAVLPEGRGAGDFEPLDDLPVVETSGPGYFQVTEQVTALAYRNGLDGCVANQPTPQPLALVTPIDRAALPDLEVIQHEAVDGTAYSSIDTADGFHVVTDLVGDATVEVTSNRLRARYRQRGIVTQYAGLHDAQLDLDCDVFRDATGQLRCAGERAFRVTFGDSCDVMNQVYASTSRYGVITDAGGAIQRVVHCEPSATSAWVLVSLIEGACRQIDVPVNRCTDEAVDLSTLAVVSLADALAAP
ncbi:MAG TPA: hypothetical protein VGC42_28880 [Kofleriaceae bacterium]